MPSEKVLIDNEHCRVTRITLEPHSHWMPEPRLRRVVVPISGHVVTRHENWREIVERGAGDAVYREASTHHIENTTDLPQTTVIVELK